MKITRTGRYRNAGTATLAEEDLTKRKLDHWSGPWWNTESNELHFKAIGGDRGSSYRYMVRFTTAEIVSFIELAAKTLPTEGSARAVAVGAAATLRELLATTDGAKPR